MLSDEIVATVVVVGAGPAGLVAATTLAHFDVDVVLLEKRPHGSALPRATVASVRTMELMRRFGVADEVFAGADDVAFTLLRTRTAAEAAEGEAMEVGYPSIAQAAMLSPVAPASVAQDHLEGVLLRHLGTRPTATVLRGVDVHTVLDDGRAGNGVRLLASEAGRDMMISADYAVAADGAWSRLRQAMGVEMHGPEELFRLVQAEVRAPLWRVLGRHRHLVYSITHPDATGVLVPAGQGDRWLYITVLDADEPTPDADEMARRFAIASGVSELPVTVERLSGAAPGAQVAHRFSSGRLYLTGDAAHRVTPRGGTGLNTAVGSARNLAWKLAWVVRGWAEPTLLDTYEPERRPVAEHNVQRSADARRALAGVLDETSVDLSGRLRHLWLTSPSSARSTLDELGPGLTLFVGHVGAGWTQVTRQWRQTHRLPLRHVDLGPRDTVALGVAPGGALLVGPDGAPLGQWTHEAGTALSRSVPWATRRVQTDSQTLPLTA